jgi:hypothetical protein
MRTVVVSSDVKGSGGASRGAAEGPAEDMLLKSLR